MTEQPSMTLKHLLATLRRGGLGHDGSSPTVEFLGLQSLLLAREAKGIRAYGKTLDDQLVGSHDFWLRMALEEFADGLMYIQKAIDKAESVGEWGTRELEHAAEQLAKTAFVLLRGACRRQLDQLARQGVDATLFPPCELKETKGP